MQKPVSILHAVNHLKTRLTETLRENEALRAELALRPPPITDIDLDALRRGVVFRCHPDRGGDTGLLRQVLELFECLGKR